MTAPRGPRVNVVALAAFAVPALAGAALSFLVTTNLAWVVAGVLVGLVLAQSPKVISQWERAVLLRLGTYVGLRGPGLFWIVPFVETPSGLHRSARRSRPALPPNRR